MRINLRKGSRRKSGKNRGEFGFKRDDTILLFCGRIIEVKDCEELLQAVINLKRPDIKLLMIGSAGFGGNVVTPYVQEVQKLVEKAGEQCEVYRIY